VGSGLAAAQQAQQSSAVPKNSSAVTGSVAGYVVYDETKLPARFTEIHLVPKPSDAELVLLKDPSTVSAEPSSQSEPRLSLALGSTGMDGCFRLDGVPTGDYFVAAIKPGYVTPGALTDPQASEDELKRLIPSLPSVSIAAGQVASVNLTLHRGAVISGRMQFADGSPAIGAGVVWSRLTISFFAVATVTRYLLHWRTRCNCLVRFKSRAGRRSPMTKDDTASMDCRLASTL
jgi:hypothetical protein